MAEAIGAVFDLTYTIQKAKRILGTRNSLFLDMFDWRPWINVELDYLLSYSATITSVEEEEAIMGGVGIPTDLLNKARDIIRTNLRNQITQALGPIRQQNRYETEFLQVDIYGEIYNLKVIDHGDIRVQQLEAKARELESEQLPEDYMVDAFDDYVPERIRRANGVW